MYLAVLPLAVDSNNLFVNIKYVQLSQMEIQMQNSHLTLMNGLQSVINSREERNINEQNKNPIKFNILDKKAKIRKN